MKNDELWNEIEAVVVDGDMTPDARDIAILAIDELRSQFSDYEALIVLQHRRAVDADRIYQEAHGWPNTKFPDLGELVGWLLGEREQLLATTTGAIWACPDCGEVVSGADKLPVLMHVCREPALIGEIMQLRAENERLREIETIAREMMAYVDMGGTTDKKFSDFIEQFRWAFGANNVQDQP